MRKDWPLRLSEEYLESTASYRLMKQGTLDLDVEAVSLIWAHSWCDAFETWGLGKGGNCCFESYVVRVKKDVQLEGEEEHCWNLADFCLVCGIKLSYHETITLYNPVCATSQEYFGTLIPAGHRYFSDASERHGIPWDHPCLSAGWFGFPPLCQHSQVWKPSFRAWRVKQEAVLWLRSFKEPSLGSKYPSRLLVGQGVDFRWRERWQWAPQGRLGE